MSDTALSLDWRTQHRPDLDRPVIVTGVFDLLHVGHLRFLTAARAAGSRLVVGVEDDRRTRAWKGPTRPLVGQDERAEMLGALRVVDGVFLIHGPPAVRQWRDYTALLADLSPAALAWTRGDPHAQVKADAAAALGAAVVEIEDVAGHSTSALVGRAGPGSR